MPVPWVPVPWVPVPVARGMWLCDEPGVWSWQSSLSAGRIPGNGEVIMQVRGGVARLAAVVGMSAGLLVASAAPVMADDDRVRVSVSSSITAGSSPGSVAVTVTRRKDDCVDVRVGLSIRLPRLEPDQVRVAISTDGDWRPVAVSGGGDGVVVSAPVEPSKSRLCERKSVSLRFRLTFLTGAPGGRATVGATAFDEEGDTLGRESDTTRVVSTAIGSPTRTPTSTATPPPVESPGTEPPASQPAVAAAPSKEADGGGGFFGVGIVVMLLGVAMVGIGIALLVVLLRRRDRDKVQDGPGEDGWGGHGMAGGSGPYPPPPGPGHPASPGTVYPTSSGAIYSSTQPGPHPSPPGPNYPPPAGGGEATAIMPRLPR